MRYKVFEIFLNRDDKIELEPVNNFKLTEAEMTLIELTLDKGMDYSFIPTKETLYLITGKDHINPGKIEVFSKIRCRDGGFVIIDPLR